MPDPALINMLFKRSLPLSIRVNIFVKIFWEISLKRIKIVRIIFYLTSKVLGIFVVDIVGVLLWRREPDRRDILKLLLLFQLLGELVRDSIDGPC